MQHGTLEILDGVAGVFDDAAEAFVGVRHVVATVEIVVDINFPIALQRIDATVEEFKFPAELKRCNEFGNFAEKMWERTGFAVEIDVDEIFPGVNGDGDEAVFGAIEVADAVEFDHTFERTVVAVGPAVIGAAEILGAALRLGDDSGGVVAAYVIKGAECAVIAARNDDGFAGEIGGEEITFARDLIQAAGDLPGVGEDGFLLETGDAGIEIPRRGNGPGFFERVVGIVEVE